MSPHDHEHGSHDHGTHDHGTHDDSCPECTIRNAHHHHHDWDHFPSEAELVAAGSLELAPTESEIALLMRMRGGSADLMPDRLGAPERITDIRGDLVKPFRPVLTDRMKLDLPKWLKNLVDSYSRVRRNAASYNEDERARLNKALAAMDGNPAWQTLMNYHASGAHRMHSMHGASGKQRFLPWHRRYVFEAEQMLRTVDPTITIPYWDYVAGSSRPDWVHRPSGVNRPTPGNGYQLPSGAAIATVLSRGDYTGFTGSLENDAHNDVHNWSGGTLGSPSTASFDPIFWMLHSNVDRIWAVWQETHTDPTLHGPSLAPPESVMDPWSATVPQLDSVVWDLGYRYG